jgi:hypothetical protein
VAIEETIAMDLHSVVCASRDQVASQVGQEIAILSVSQGKYFGLNPVGASIWTWLRTPTRIGDILTRILEEYDVQHDQCRDDLLSFLGSLKDSGLVEIHDDAAQQISTPSAG